MHDGIHLSTHVFRPLGSGKFPTILVRTPYGKGADISSNHQAFVDHGYAVVLQDVRGHFDSEGSDGNDTINWIARQPWSDGKVGMMGGSYLGIMQWRAATVENPHLKAIFPLVSGYDEYQDRYYSTGGAFKIGHRLLWLAENFRPPGAPKPDFDLFTHHVPLRTADRVATGRTLSIFQEAMDHPSFDDFWKQISTKEKIDHIKIPVFSVGGWYDNYAESDLAAFAALRKHSKLNHTIIGPWPHNMDRFAGIDFGAAATIPLRTIQIEWFDYWLKGPVPGSPSAALVNSAPLRVFVMGANRWREATDWPIPGTRFQPFYLESKGHANTVSGDGVLTDKMKRKDTPDSYTFDPHNPVPTLGGAVCCNPKIFPWGPMDQRLAERRSDVLVYTTPPLKKDLEVTGPIQVVLSISSSAPDTDFTAKLVDVFPDGSTHNLTDGILRARYRNSLESPALMKPGTIYPLRIDAGVTSNVFKAGHSIRLEISSSNFPRFDRNPNTGRTVADDTEFRLARQTVYHDRQTPSYVLLPVIVEK